MPRTQSSSAPIVLEEAICQVRKMSEDVFFWFVLLGDYDVLMMIYVPPVALGRWGAGLSHFGLGCWPLTCADS